MSTDPNKPIESTAIDDLVSSPAAAMSEQRKIGMLMMVNAMVEVYAKKVMSGPTPHMLKQPKIMAYQEGAKDMFECIYKHMEDQLDGEQIG